MKKKIWFSIILALFLISGAFFILQKFSDIKLYTVIKDSFKNILFGASKQSWPSPEKQLNIFIRDKKFLPNATAAKVGVRVTWYNEDSIIHAIVGEGWNSDQIPPGQVFSKTFKTAGTYKYHCSINPEMIGEIIIQ